MDKKYICEYCGCDLLKEGIQVDISGRAYFNKKTKHFEYEVDGRDGEVKCPECYAYADVPSKLTTGGLCE